jgi:hypothetical protein
MQVQQGHIEEDGVTVLASEDFAAVTQNIA